PASFESNDWGYPRTNAPDPFAGLETPPSSSADGTARLAQRSGPGVSGATTPDERFSPGEPQQGPYVDQPKPSATAEPEAGFTAPPPTSELPPWQTSTPAPTASQQPASAAASAPPAQDTPPPRIPG